MRRTIRPSRRTTAAAIALGLALVGCSSDDGAEPLDGTGLTFVGQDELTWAEPELAASAGQLDLTLECGDNAPHGLAIEGVADGAELATCEPGGSATATADLGAGTYEFFCTVPGHREAGMVGTLTVS